MTLLWHHLKLSDWHTQLAKGAKSLLPKSLIKLNTVTIAVVGATSALLPLKYHKHGIYQDRRVRTGKKNLLK